MAMLDVVIPVHNGRQVICQTLELILKQEGISDGCRIIVVDDGSTDGTAELVAAVKDPRIQLLRMPQCAGRASARNAGVAASAAEAVLLLDADCRPLDVDLIRRHMRALADGCDLSFGPVTAMGDDFWSYYARVVADEREARIGLGDYLAMTSANIAIRRALFDGCGGFHEGYCHYGFEDRDLIARLLECKARPHYDPLAVVLHDAQASVAVLCRKMDEAGRHTAGIFQQRYPYIYRDMRFSRVDVRTAPAAVRVMSGLLSRLASPVKALASRSVDIRWLPAGWRLALVRLAVALAFLRGTLRADEVSAGDNVAG